MDSNSTEKKNKENGGNDNFKQPFAVPKKVVLAQVNDPNRTNSNTNAAASAQRAVKPVGSTQAKVFAPLDNLQASAVRPTSQTSQTRYPPSSNIDSRRSSGVFVKPASGFKSPDFPKAVVGSKPIFKDNRSAKSTPGGQANENARNPANAAPGTVTPPTKPKPKPIQKRHSDVPPLRTNEKSSSKDAREFKSFVFYFDPATVSDAEKNELIEQLGKLGAVSSSCTSLHPFSCMSLTFASFAAHRKFHGQRRYPRHSPFPTWQGKRRTEASPHLGAEW